FMDSQVGLRHAVLRTACRKRDPERRGPGPCSGASDRNIREIDTSMPVLDRPRHLLGRGLEQTLGYLKLLATVLLHLGAVMDPVWDVPQLDVARDVAAVRVRERSHQRLR